MVQSLQYVKFTTRPTGAIERGSKAQTCVDGK